MADMANPAQFHDKARGSRQNRRLAALLVVLSLLPLIVFPTAADPLAQSDPVPTLVPPTLVPAVDTGEGEGVALESGIARILKSGRVRIGILYNEPPFGEYNLRGEVIGFDADLARAIAETWGVEVRFKQVTRQTAEEMLERREVDMLIAAQVHRRELDTEFEFSQTYYPGSQSVMVRSAEGGPKTLAEMANRRVGIVLQTPSSDALTNWSRRTGIAVNAVPYPTLVSGYNALMSGEVDGLVASRYQLVEVATQPDAITILEEPIELEPYAIALPRQDVSLRNLVNQTLQYLRVKGKFAEIRQIHFPESSYLPTLWAGLGEDAPKPDQFNTEVTYPAQYVVPRLQTQRVLRVAIQELPTATDGTLLESQQRLNTFHRSLLDEFARRWGVQVEYIPVADAAQAIDAVANGQAELAVGVQPTWEQANRVDFTGPYLLRGLRLMVKKNSNIAGFAELRGGRYVAYPLEQPEVQQIALQEGERANAFVRTFGSREADLALNLLDTNNADVALADSIALLPFIEQYPNDLQLTKGWYRENYVVMATPQNDLDFRLLTEYTLQELVRDGTLQRLLAPVMLPEDIPTFDIWPGTGNTYGFLTGN